MTHRDGIAGVLVAALAFVAFWPGSWPTRVAALFVGDDVTGPPPRTPRSVVRPPGEPSEVAACVELLVVALSAGMTLHGAIEAVGALEGHRGAEALRAAASGLQRGVPLLDVLDELATVGRGWQVVATTMALAAADGTAVLPALRLIAATERTRQRRAVERRVRRLPVVLLVPLVGLVLPAFVLVTFVPVVMALGGEVVT